MEAMGWEKGEVEVEVERRGKRSRRKSVRVKDERNDLAPKVLGKGKRLIWPNSVEKHYCAKFSLIYLLFRGTYLLCLIFFDRTLCLNSYNGKTSVIFFFSSHCKHQALFFFHLQAGKGMLKTSLRVTLLFFLICIMQRNKI